MKSKNSRNFRKGELIDICKQLGQKRSGKREELKLRISSFLRTPHGKEIGMSCLSPSVIESILEDNAECFCNRSKPDPMIECIYCESSYHKSCVSTESAVCPSCQLVKLVPLDIPQSWLIRTFILSYGLKNCSVSEKSLTLDRNTYSEIANSKGTLKVQIRCVKLSSKSFVQKWPKLGNLMINDRTVADFNSSDNVHSKERKDDVINITHVLKEGKNSIRIMRFSDSDQYAACVLLVRSLSEEEYVQQILSKPPLVVEEERKAILKHLVDEEVMISSGIFSLKCPFTLSAMKNPVRGIDCDHVACFDLTSYVQKQKYSRINRWMCPVCNKFTRDLIRSSFFETVLEQASNIEDPYSVKIFPDLSFNVQSFEIALFDDKANQARMNRRKYNPPNEESEIQQKRVKMPDNHSRVPKKVEVKIQTGRENDPIELE